MIIKKLEEEISSTTYPGRGILFGKTPDGKNTAIAYFIMGRSENSRNRIFVEEGEDNGLGKGLRTEAFDPSKLQDPSLIIYAPVRILGKDVIVTNGDQTDTIYDLMKEGKTFEESLRTREFEPDVPNFTPRISGVIHTGEEGMPFEMSILKSDAGDPECCLRYQFSYDKPKAGVGRFIHTYMGDGNPLPSYEGEPTPVAIEDNDLENFTKKVWNSLNEENKVSLFTRFIGEDGSVRTCILNKNQ